MVNKRQRKLLADAIRKGADMVGGRKIKLSFFGGNRDGEIESCCAQGAIKLAVNSAEFIAMQAARTVLKNHPAKSEEELFEYLELIPSVNDGTEFSLHEIADLVESGEIQNVEC